MNDQEKAILKSLNDLTQYMTKNTRNVDEKDAVASSLDKLFNQLTLIVGRRTIKESK